jgi:drug/metabolite transporter (DMT)-like permease
MLIKPRELAWVSVIMYRERGLYEGSVAVANKQWSELSTGQRQGIVFSGVVQVVLLVAALTDIWRRPEEEIRGNKRMWALVSFVNFVGPIAYFAFGRRR